MPAGNGGHVMGGVFGPDAVCVLSSAVALAFLQVVKPSAAQGAAGVVLYISQVSLCWTRLVKTSVCGPSTGRKSHPASSLVSNTEKKR